MVIHVFNSTVVSGPETLVLPSLAKLAGPVGVVFLKETRRRDTSHLPVEYARSFGLDVYEIEVRSRYDRDAISKLSALFERLGPRVVHAHDVKASLYTLRATQSLEKKWRLVSTHHGVRGRPGLKIKGYEWYYTRFILPHFDRVLAVCSSDRALLLKRGLKEDQVIVHLNGVDRNLVLPEEREDIRAEIRKSWNLAGRGIENDIFLIGIVGRLAKGKGLERTLKVFAETEKKFPFLPPWRGLFFGTGTMGEELKAQAKKLNVGHRVEWMGYRDGIGNESAGFDIVLSMSEAEGLPINLVEAGWGATPVLATRVDGNLDLIPASSVGTLIDLKEKDVYIARLLAEIMLNQKRRADMGAAFQTRVRENFSGQRWIKDLAAIYGLF